MPKKKSGEGGGVQPGVGCQGGYELRIIYCENDARKKKLGTGVDVRVDMN